MCDTKPKPNYDPALLDFLQGCADEVATMLAENPAQFPVRGSSMELEVSAYGFRV